MTAVARPRLCYICQQPATVSVQRQRPVTVLGLKGQARRGHEWVGRYLCSAHEDLDPWDLP